METFKIVLAADYLIKAGFIPILLDNISNEKEEIAALHLETLCSLMYGKGKTYALELGAFEILVSIIATKHCKMLKFDEKF